jgi:hypothetical protein
MAHLQTPGNSGGIENESKTSSPKLGIADSAVATPMAVGAVILRNFSSKFRICDPTGHA